MVSILSRFFGLSSHIDCGFPDFTAPETELALLAGGTPEDETLIPLNT
jgi:hypothetical protein